LKTFKLLSITLLLWLASPHQVLAQQTNAAAIDPNNCSCNKWKNISLSWSSTPAGDPTTAATTVPSNQISLECSKSYNVGCNVKYNFAFDYQCKPSVCNAAMDIIVAEPNGNTVTFTNINTASFVYIFSLPGTYTMTIQPKCGGVVCSPCVLYFNTNCPSCCTELLKTVTDQTPVVSGNLLTVSTSFVTTQPVQTIEATVLTIQSTVTCPQSVSSQSLPAVITAGNCIGYTNTPVYSGEYHFLNGSSTSPTPVIQLQLPAAPPNTSCKEEIKVCIRYLLKYADNCKSCEVTRCFTIPRKGSDVIVDPAKAISQ
jgi:hypothetical protein